MIDFVLYEPHINFLKSDRTQAHSAWAMGILTLYDFLAKPVTPMSQGSVRWELF